MLFGISVNALLRSINFLNQGVYRREFRLQLLLLQPVPLMVGLSEGRNESFDLRSGHDVLAHVKHIVMGSVCFSDTYTGL